MTVYIKTTIVAIALVSTPALAQGNGQGAGQGGPLQSGFKKGHCIIMQSPTYKPTWRDSVRRALRPLTMPGARRWLRARGGVSGLIRRGLTQNRLARLPGTIKAKRRSQLHGAIVGTLRRARSQQDRSAFSIGRVVDLKPVGGGQVDAKVAFLSKRSGGKTERIVRLQLRNSFLGSLLGRTPKVSVVGLRPGVSLSSLAPLAGGESLIAGEKTMLGIRGVAPGD